MTTGDGWIQRVRGFDVAEVAEILGLTVERGTLRPCPLCVAEARGSTDKRGPIGIRPDGRGWRCHRCQADGDAVALVAARVLGRVKPEGADDWAAVRAWCAGAGLCEGRTAGAAPRVALRPIPAPRPPAPPVRVPSAELLALWDGATAPVSTVPEVAAWIASRKLDAAEVERRELARAIVAGDPLPAWARFKGRPWTESGHRLLVGLYDARGALVSVQARSILADVPKGEKAGNPAPVLDEAATRAAGVQVWTRFELGGAVMADARGLALLRGSFPVPRKVYIAEGVPDFLTAATARRDPANAPAVLGIVAGAWRPELAARIPQGARVVVATHNDPTGDVFAARIAATLAGRVVIRGSFEQRQAAQGAQ
jgi:hypothetical protein